MSPRPNARPHGQIRQSQVVTTFGPGALLDLPNYSVLVGGLDYWSKGGEEVYEDRLIEKLKRLLDVPSLKLYTPPPDNEDPTVPQTGIRAWQFPEWFTTQDVEDAEKNQMIRSRRLIHRTALTRGKFIDQDRRKRPVVPIRFVRACTHGHIGDLSTGTCLCIKSPSHAVVHSGLMNGERAEILRMFQFVVNVAKADRSAMQQYWIKDRSGPVTALGYG